MADCVFCSIVAGDVPAEILQVTERTTAFADMHPQAETHVLVIPNDHHPDLASVAAADPAVAAEMLTAAAAVATAAGHQDYRIVANTGAGAGQTVFHAHLHVLAGEMKGWPA